jgi:hypothetical protein
MQLFLIGFKTTLQKFGVKHYSTVVVDKSCKSQADVYKNYKGDFSKRNFIFIERLNDIYPDRTRWRIWWRVRERIYGCQ